MRLNDKQISIIGAGIGGIAAAVALAQKGARVTVFEQAEALGEVGAGLQISPNGVTVLHALGLKEAAQPLANAPNGIVLRDYRGAQAVRLPIADAPFGQPYWQFHRADLLQVLNDAALTLGVEFRFGHSVKNVARNGAGALVEFEGHDSALADCLIAADGVRSVTRGAVFRGEDAEFTGQVAWRGLVPADRLPAGLFPNETQVFMGKGRHLVAYPLRGGKMINFVAVEERKNWADEGWNIPDDPQNLRNAFAGWCEPVEKLLNEVDHTFLWGLFKHRELAKWSDGQVALLGDSCHAMLPFIAQGATMALEDAWVLADALSLADDIPAGLRQYEDRRKNRTTKVQNAAQRNAWAYHLRMPIFRELAHAVLRRSNGAKMLAKYDWLYGYDVTRDS